MAAMGTVSKEAVAMKSLEVAEVVKEVLVVIEDGVQLVVTVESVVLKNTSGSS